MLQTTGDCLFSGSLAAAGCFHVFWHHWIRAPFFTIIQQKVPCNALGFAKFLEFLLLICHYTAPGSSWQLARAGNEDTWAPISAWHWHLAGAHSLGQVWEGFLQCQGTSGWFVWQGVCFKKLTGTVEKYEPSQSTSCEVLEIRHITMLTHSYATFAEKKKKLCSNIYKYLCKFQRLRGCHLCL